MKSFYISIQDLDYDDYPMGPDQKIGLFESQEEAEQYLENNDKFSKRYYAKDFFSWKLKSRSLHKHSVTIKDFTKEYMIKPEDFRG